MLVSSKIARSLLTNSSRKFRRPATSATSLRFATRNYFTSINSTTSKSFTRNFQSTTIKMGVHNVESKAAFDEALKNEVVVLDCFATWCGPCKVIAPKVVEYSEEFPSAHFIKVDVDEVPDVAQELGIRAMPTFIIFKGGEKVGEIVGANPPALRAAIAKAVGGA